MARKAKQTVDYFPHMASSGKTIFILESRYGNDGYAFWFKLLELIASTEGHVIDVNNSAEWQFLLAKTKVSEETASSILDLLSELNAIDKELWNKKIIWSTNFVENVSDVYTRRKVQKPLKPEIENCLQHESTSERIIEAEIEQSEEDVNINQQSKVKESKVNKTKVEESKVLGQKKDMTLPPLIKFYESNGFGTISPFIIENIQKWVADFKQLGSSDEEVVDLIIIAMQGAVSYNARNWRYVETILSRYFNKNYTNKDMVLANESRRKADQEKKADPYDEETGLNW